MNLFKNINSDYPVIAWWSGGITSAVACYLSLQWFGKENVRLVFIDTKNEDADTYRFMDDCKNWYDADIEKITNDKYSSIRDVWYKYLSLNVATGAICSSELKRQVRIEFQKNNNYSYQIFGYDIKEISRAISQKYNNPDSKPIFPLIIELLTKKQCGDLIIKNKIELPRTYKLGYHNNNCFETGCVQGGIGYWQKMLKEFPDKFNNMANDEHELSRLKGKPVTMLRDQAKNGGLLFLKHNPEFPDVKDISMKKDYPVKPLFECNGFCGTNDLSPNKETESEINFDFDNK